MSKMFFCYSDSNQEEEFHFQSLEDVEESAGCDLDTLNILTDHMVLQKIQSGCDVAVDQAVNLSHVVELYDFPATLKTSDLDDVLHQLKLQNYYELIWVDDTHAFAIMVCTFGARLKPYNLLTNTFVHEY